MKKTLSDGSKSHSKHSDVAKATPATSECKKSKPKLSCDILEGNPNDEHSDSFAMAVGLEDKEESKEEHSRSLDDNAPLSQLCNISEKKI